MPVTFEKPWNEANSYCANTTIKGQTGWRLPTKEELEGLYKSGAMEGKLWKLYVTWSSTPYNGYHYWVALDNGSESLPVNNATRVYVSCVR